MQLSSFRSGVPWLFLPALAFAATNLGTPSSLNQTLDRALYCHHDDPYGPNYQPFHFTSSLNYTFPDTPPIPRSYLDSIGFKLGEGDYPFDCFLELPGGIFVFEIKGDIDSSLHLAFEIWLGVLAFNYKIGVFSCDLTNLDEDPCAFNINNKYFKGQGGLYPKEDPDPKYIELCVEIHGTAHVPYTRISKNINFDKCFIKVAKPDQVTATS